MGNDLTFLKKLRFLWEMTHFSKKASFPLGNDLIFLKKPRFLWEMT
jgi:hypothetical protein